MLTMLQNLLFTFKISELRIPGRVFSALCVIHNTFTVILNIFTFKITEKTSESKKKNIILLSFKHLYNMSSNLKLYE